MSMERQMKDSPLSMEPLQENIEEAPSFLKRVVNLGQSNTKERVNSQPSNLSVSSKTSQESEHVESNHTKYESGSPGSKDEGLGESFDQNSESSESSVERKIGSEFTEQYNGVKNSVYDTVPEEKASANGSGERDTESLTSGRQNSEEIALDPSKLPGYDQINQNVENGNTMENSISNNETESDGKTGLTKSVSFFGDGNGNVEAEPVSDTYVYNEKPKGWFGKMRSNKK